MTKDTLAALLFFGAFAVLLYALTSEYKCSPVEVKETCRLSRYEVRIYDTTAREKRLVGVAEGACVFVAGEGRYRRYVMTDASFTAQNRTDFFDRVEFPAAQSLVCEVR
jgi:hypothetical protein